MTRKKTTQSKTKVIKGSGGLKAPGKFLNWKYLLAIGVVICLAGGFLVYTSRAGSYNMQSAKGGNYGNVRVWMCSLRGGSGKRAVQAVIVRPAKAPYGVVALRTSIVYASSHNATFKSTPAVAAWAKNTQKYSTSVPESNYVGVNVRFSNNALERFQYVPTDSAGWIVVRASQLPKC